MSSGRTRDCGGKTTAHLNQDLNHIEQTILTSEVPDHESTMLIILIVYRVTQFQWKSQLGVVVLAKTNKKKSHSHIAYH